MTAPPAAPTARIPTDRIRMGRAHIGGPAAGRTTLYPRAVRPQPQGGPYSYPPGGRTARSHRGRRLPAAYPPQPFPSQASRFRRAGRPGLTLPDHRRRAATLEAAMADRRRHRGTGRHRAGGDPGAQPRQREQADHGHPGHVGLPSSKARRRRSRTVRSRPRPTARPTCPAARSPRVARRSARASCRSRPPRRPDGCRFSDDQTPNLIGAVGVAQEVPGAKRWVMQAEVAVTNFVSSMDVTAQASKLIQCVASGPGYANASPTLGPTRRRRSRSTGSRPPGWTPTSRSPTPRST